MELKSMPEKYGATAFVKIEDLLISPQTIKSVFSGFILQDFTAPNK